MKEDRDYVAQAGGVEGQIVHRQRERNISNLPQLLGSKKVGAPAVCKVTGPLGVVPR